MTERRPLRLATAFVSACATVCMALAGAGFLDGNEGWVPAWALIALLYGVLTWGLASGRLWAPALAQGAALLGVGIFAQCSWALGSFMPAIVAGLGVHLLLGLLALGLDDGLSSRQRWSLRFASVALVPSALFALAPEQSGGTMVAVLGGAALVWLGAFGVARGRTWGVLAALLGAPVLATAVAFAPELSFFHAEHFLVDQPLLPLMLDALGVVAASAAVLAVAPFLGPIARYLTRASAS